LANQTSALNAVPYAAKKRIHQLALANFSKNSGPIQKSYASLLAV
jgi:hypothetical protein